MTEHSEPTLPFPAKPHTGEPITFKAFAARCVFWAPVWLPMIVLAQIAWLGFGPALAESRRLDEARCELSWRVERELTERASLERVVRAQNDPIYLERERRLLRAENGPLSVK